MTPFAEPIAEFIWDNKYRYRYNDTIIDQTVEETWQRVAKAVAENEAAGQRQDWQQQFFDILSNFSFLPGGRILAGAGTRHKVTLLNCYVMGIIEDSLDGIFSALKEGALTLQQGGGIGYDFSSLRPAGVLATESGGIASGPVSFMKIWDSMSSVMQSTGARRGAMMGTLRCDHPDIEKFIEAKSHAEQLRHFNVSVLVSDDFLQAVNNNKEWSLVFPINEQASSSSDTIQQHWPGFEKPVACRVFKRVSARKLWDKIIKSAYDCAEPGVIFIDTINRQNNLWYCEKIYTTNPCGEIPLPPYGACNLGSINLSQFVTKPFANNASFNWSAMEKTVNIAVRMLDNVLDISTYPLPQQQQCQLASRRIGLGITGLADALVMLGERYGSVESQQLATNIMKTISETAWQSSIELAREKGAFPAFKKADYLKGEFVAKLPNEIRNNINKHGVRNSHHTTIAPTGTTSLFANNVSNGLEPIFDAHYQRHVRTSNGDLKTFALADYAYRLWQQSHPSEKKPPAWVDAQQLKPVDHLMIQAAVQPYIDNAISKTIFIPEDFPFKQVENIFSQAYQLGLKGCTIFRPNPVTGNVLVADRCVETG